MTNLPWVPDLGDGRYKNPVLNADYSDPDAVCVGDDYWMTSSSFCHVPALPILHSRDLVNWTLVNHALPALVPTDHFTRARAGEGVWAPAIRHHDEKFWIYYPDPDFGIYVITATDPRGAWSKPVLVKGGKGLIDPCPLWDDDGQVWLVHGWARSRAGIANLLTLNRLDAKGERVTDEGEIIIDANKLEGWTTLEGPKFYKRNGWYYIFAPAGGVRDGYQAIFRSRNIRGPYESRIVLEQGNSPINGPHQGAWVDTPTGEHWFLHFQELPALGRVVHMQPMRWEDDWPLMGTSVDGAARGEPVLTYRKPSLPVQPMAVPPGSDDFSKPALGLQWQWQANPAQGWVAINASAKKLRLTCVPMVEAGSHWLTPNLLMQKFPAPVFKAGVAMRFPDAATAGKLQIGDHAGLMVFGYDYAWIGLRREKDALRLVLSVCREAQKQKKEEAVVSLDAPTSGELFLRVEVTKGSECHFSYSADGKHYVRIGGAFQASSSRWVGAKVGVFASSAHGNQGGASAEFCDFTMTA